MSNLKQKQEDKAVRKNKNEALKRKRKYKKKDFKTSLITP